ncbi:hypothetical protein [Shimia sp. SDUM112013]|uniref:hypothetical protein n=1 Tax=Shimia sp. SDUM112013 TaxID=3136160 RepID=UPI0032EAC720
MTFCSFAGDPEVCVVLGHHEIGRHFGLNRDLNGCSAPAILSVPSGISQQIHLAAPDARRAVANRRLSQSNLVKF